MRDFEQRYDRAIETYKRGQRRRYSWNESDHPRGQPENAGQFAPHKMTKQQFADSPAGKQSGNADAVHRADVQKAVNEGKSVSPEVMKDYPDLKTLPANKPNPNATVPGESPDTAKVVSELGATKQPPTPPPPGEVYNPDPAQGKAARVGVPGDVVPPPPKEVPRLPNLTPDEREQENKFAQMFESDPDGMAQKMIEAAGRKELGNDGPSVFGTDDAKMLFKDWVGTSVPGPDGKPVTSPETLAYRSKYNTALHQTANAIAKRAFVKYLDDVVSKQPPEQRHVLVTAGGVAAGKGYAIGKVDQVKNVSALASATWDTAGEQNSTELPWVAAECKKRGIKMTAVYVHADPEVTWENPKGGVISRAAGKGRMVDARAYADSYGYGAKNFHKWHQTVANDPDIHVAVLDNPRGGTPSALPAVPEQALAVDADQLYARCLKVLESYPASQEVKQGGSAGTRIWGPPAA